MLPYFRVLAPALESGVHLVRVVEAPINEVAFATRPQYYQGIQEAETHKAVNYLAGVADITCLVKWASESKAAQN